MTVAGAGKRGVTTRPSEHSPKEQEELNDVRKETYHCVFCLHPTPTLYRTYSTPSAVRLTPCANCGAVAVDPYIERELFLVLLDLILLRTMAYRHMLWNREPFCQFNPFVKAVKKGSNSRSKAKAVQFILAAAVMDAFLRLESVKSSEKEQGTRTTDWTRENSLSEVYFSLVLASTMDLLLLISTVIISAFLILCMFNGVHQKVDPQRLISRLYLSVIGPCAFHFVTVFVHVWETSSVRTVASILVGAFRCMAICTIMEREFLSRQPIASTDTKSHGRTVSPALWGLMILPFLSGMFVHSFVPHLYSVLIRRILSSTYNEFPDALPCSGLGWRAQTVLFGHSIDEWLCLT